VGAEFGSKRMSAKALQRVLAGVLVLASMKIFLAG
jgi:hypothetical protein